VDDKELIAAVRDVGIIEEEIALSRAQIQKMKKMGSEDSDDEGEEKKRARRRRRIRRRKERTRVKRGKIKTPRRERRREDKRDPKSSNVPIDFTALKRVWDTPFQALKGIDQGQIDKFKEAEKDCIRCGYDGHRTVHCYRKKDADGNTLPPAPKERKDKAAASATKRKRGDLSSSSDSGSSSSESESESEPEPKSKPRRKKIKATASGAKMKGIEDANDAKRTHAAAAAKAQQDHWFEDESEAELESDF
jgi:hypothetical protein